MLVLGSGPLLITILAASRGWMRDRNPNPVGFGIMAFMTFWPGLALILAVLIVSLARHRTARKHYATERDRLRKAAGL